MRLRNWRKIIPDGRRRCSSCEDCANPDGPYLPATAEYFHRYANAYDGSGLGSRCKACVRAASQRPERLENQNVKARVRYSKNPEKYREKQRAERERNRESYLLSARLGAQRHRARKRSLPDRFTNADWLNALTHFKGCCAVCGRPPGLWHTLAMDHWIPLSSPDCPGTVPGNIVPLCHGIDGCNNMKCDRSAREWLISTYGPLKAMQIERQIEAWFSEN